MQINKLKQRLRKDRPMTMISFRMPEDVVEDLKRVAPQFQSLRKHGVEEAVIASAMAEAQVPAETA